MELWIFWRGFYKYAAPTALGCVLAFGKDLLAAYAAVEKINFEGAHFRRDIAANAF